MDATLVELGWDAGFAGAFESHQALGREPARVVAVHKETSIVRTAADVRRAVVSGRFRFEATSRADYPAVGDWVAIEGPPELTQERGVTATAVAHGAAIIAAVLPRRSAIRRSAGDSTRRKGARDVDEQVLAANVDVGFVVAGLDGDFNLRRIERYLAVAWASGVQPVILLNKTDVADDIAGRRVAVEAIAPGVQIAALSALTRSGLAGVGGHLRAGRTAVVLGSSGVGKSTLVNALLGEDRQATREVRADDSRGRHTTSHRELFALPGGALLIDTPGIRALEVAGADEGLAPAFEDVAAIAELCRFADCRHQSEPGCAVRVALAEGRLSEDRLASHRKLERELAHAERKGDPRARADERRRWRTIWKSVEKHMDAKYGEEWR